MEYKIAQGNSAELLKYISDNSIDMTITSPPYDSLRNYNNNELEWSLNIFQEIANELYRVTKQGGVVIWIVADKTENGSETGTSFKQALYFKELGFNIHDTMIYRKENYVPLTHNRYEQEWEYMFCFSKGKPKTFNPIKVPCKYAGQEHWGKSSYYKTDDDELTSIVNKKVHDDKIKGNIFSYRVGSTTESKKYKHPAMFPLDLVKDQIISWSNEEEWILDTFMGSGTTGIACIDLNRNFIGIENEQKYFEMAKQRIEEYK